MANNDNLIYKAALALQRVTATNYGANITLVKNLPIAAGLGGGSSDAAVTLVSLNKLWDLQLTHTELAAIALTLGADVPSCLAAQACWVEGIGEQITPLELPPLYLVIATPPCPISTIWSYQQIRPPYTPTLGGCALHLQTRDDLVEFLKQQHNDLQNAPLSLVQPTLAALEATGPLLSRMSGSGPSCFGIYGDREGAEAAARQIKQTNPSWWVVATTTRG